MHGDECVACKMYNNGSWKWTLFFIRILTAYTHTHAHTHTYLVHIKGSLTSIKLSEQSTRDVPFTTIIPGERGRERETEKDSINHKKIDHKKRNTNNLCHKQTENILMLSALCVFTRTPILSAVLFIHKNTHNND